MDKPSREPADPAVQCRVCPCRYARAHEDFTQQHEKRDCNQRRVVRRRPNEVAKAADKRKETEELVNAEAKQKKHDPHGDRKREKAEEEEPAKEKAGEESTEITELEAAFRLFPWAYVALKVLGAAYLIWIAVGLWRNAAAPVKLNSLIKMSSRRSLSPGLRTNDAVIGSVLSAACSSSSTV